RWSMSEVGPGDTDKPRSFSGLRWWASKTVIKAEFPGLANSATRSREEANRPFAVRLSGWNAGIISSRVWRRQCRLTVVWIAVDADETAQLKAELRTGTTNLKDPRCWWIGAPWPVNCVAF